MATIPSVKGSVFIAIVEDVQKLARRAEGEARGARPLAARQGPVALLDAQILAHEWYDVRVYARMSELLRDVEGGGRNEYLAKRGARSARRLLDAGLYASSILQKATFGRNGDPKERFAALGRDLARTTTLSAAILNFGRWEAKPDPGNPRRWIMEVTGARDYPEPRLGLVRLLERAVAHAEPARPVDLERPEPDRIVFRMTRDL